VVVENFGGADGLSPAGGTRTQEGMAAKKKIQASDVGVGNRSLEAMLADTNDRIADGNARIDRTLDEIKAIKIDVQGLREQQAVTMQRLGDLHEATMRMHEVTMNELRTVAAALMSFAGKTDERLRELEEKAA